MSAVQHKTIEVDSVNVFYREAGKPSLPGLLLLHGHASSSHTFRNIIEPLSSSFHVVAPDYPGQVFPPPKCPCPYVNSGIRFGNSDRPKDYTYNFVNLANTIDLLTEKVGLATYSVYAFDFGGPIAFLLGSKHPERVTGIFSQSGNTYNEGLSPGFEPIRAMWAKPEDPTVWEPLKHIFSPEGIQWAYKHGIESPELISPDPANLDIYYTSREGALDIQLALLRDYETNVKSYPEWQAYLRKHKPKVVAIWGKNDPFFAPPGAEALKRDVPEADVTVLDNAAHFLCESHPETIIAGLKKLL